MSCASWSICRLFGPDVSTALSRYRATVQRATACLTDGVVRAQPPIGDAPGGLLFADVRGVPLAGGMRPMALRLHQLLSVDRLTGAHRSERYVVRLAGYMYVIEERTTETELFAFHWHPNSAKTFPHLHPEAATCSCWRAPNSAGEVISSSPWSRR
jgi:hypothetical protein